MRVIGIVGSEGAKFTPQTEARARKLIRRLLTPDDVVGVSSGACHLGGIDLWAEEEAKSLSKYDASLIFAPLTRSWKNGYKPRNLKIAEASSEVHCITIAEYPAHYDGMKFDYCYHCGTDNHVKSGGCWTALMAVRMGKPGFVHVIGEGKR